MADQQEHVAPAQNENENHDAQHSIVSDDTSSLNESYNGAPQGVFQRQNNEVPQYGPMVPPSNFGQPPPPYLAMAQYYEAQMRGHAAAYATAAAGAAWAAAQIASSSYHPAQLPPAPSFYPPTGMPPSLGSPSNSWNPHVAADNEESNPRPEKRQFRLNKEGSDSSNTSTRRTKDRKQPYTQRHFKKDGPSAKRARRLLRSSGGGSSESSRSSSNRKDMASNKKKHRRSEKLETFLGKTGVSVLYEFCEKRQLPAPNFCLHESNSRSEFCMTAVIDKKEYGRGRGGTKANTKQDAARRALQALVPGSVFDAKGVLVEIPEEDGSTSRLKYALEDLAPNLASQLAIGNDNDNKRPKRRWDVYPGTSTTSEDDDENMYYASRGASVCSALLHAMWQIRDDIPEPPSFAYDVLAPEACLKRKGPSGELRSSFACTATLLLVESISETDKSEKEKTEENPDDSAKSTSESEEAKSPKSSDEDKDAGELPVEDAEPRKTVTLTAVGTGTTKREARHTSSAKLLAMLFPECSGMLEVKEAAEAARENFAAIKALKIQESRRSYHSFTKARRRTRGSSTALSRTSYLFALPSANDPPLPEWLMEQLRNVVNGSSSHSSVDSPTTCGLADGIASVAALSLSEKAEDTSGSLKVDESLARQLSRQQQLEEEVDAALQSTNEVDETGQSLSVGLAEDIVGRTVLRRARTEDLGWVEKLLQNSKPKSRKPLFSSKSPFSLLQPSGSAQDEDVDKNPNLSCLLWGSMSVVLLLCRAVAMDDEPPLGCAILTLGFSLSRGPLLNVSEIAHETHLPEERFLECLQAFAENMKCNLLLKRAEDNRRMRSRSHIRLRSTDMQAVLNAHIGGTHHDHSEGIKSAESIFGPRNRSMPLQSVKEEESECEEDGSNVLVKSAKRQEKPNKRSRVA